MAACFPFSKYVFFITIFVISIIILKTSTTLEHMALILLTAFMAMFGLTLIVDLFSGVPDLRWEIVSIPVSAILIFVGVLLTTMGYHKLYMEFKLINKPVRVSEFFRNVLEKFKDISLSAIVLMLSTLFVLTFFPEKNSISKHLHLVFDILTNGRHSWVAIGRGALAIISFALIFSMIDKMKGSPIRMNVVVPRDSDMERKQKDVYTRFTAAGFGIPFFMGFFGFVHYMFQGNRVSVMATYLSRIIYLMFFIVFCMALTTFIRYDMETVFPFSVPFIVMIMFLMISLVAEYVSIYLPNIIEFLLKKCIPLAMLGLSGYLVYLGDAFFIYTKHESVS